MRGDKFLTATVAIILLSNLLPNIFLWSTRDMATAVLGDLAGQRILCAYTLHGIDPYPQIGVEPRTSERFRKTSVPRLGD